MAAFRRADNTGMVIARKVTADNHADVSQWLHSRGLALFPVTDALNGKVLIAENPPRALSVAEFGAEFTIPDELLPEFGTDE